MSGLRIEWRGVLVFLLGIVVGINVGLLFARFYTTEPHSRAEGGTELVFRDLAFNHTSELENDVGLHKRSKSMRVAHCIVGAARTLNFPEVYQLYKTNGILPLGASSDLFFVTGLDSSIHGVSVAPKRGEDYITALQYLSPWIEKVVWDNSDPGCNGYNRWLRCSDLIRDAEARGNFTYDYVIKSRPDLIILRQLPDLHTLSPDTVLINPYYEYAGDVPETVEQAQESWKHAVVPGDSASAGNLPISDIFAIIPRKLADHYLRLNERQELPFHVCGAAGWWCECRLKASLHKGNVPWQIYPFVVKIRREYKMCKEKSWNIFNGVC